MKQLYTTLVAIIAIVQCASAQWQYTGSDIYFNTGKAVIGTTPIGKFTIDDGGTGASYSEILTLKTTYGIPARKALTWRDGSNITGQIDTYFDGTRTNMSFGHLYNSGYQTGDILTLLGNGNVGIGTTSPHQRLDLNGGSLAMGDINATGVITFRNDIPVGTAGSVGLSAIDAAGNGNYDGLGLHVSDGLKILSGANTYFTLLTATGNIGIGTTQPDQKLTVNGTIHSKEVKVDTTIPVPDYVFDSAYKLPELSELKTYLDANHHLPEIPSAKEMEKNGINLSEMNLKLLKKVEELTLYAIEQKQENQKLKEKTQQQQQQLDELKTQVQALKKTLIH